MSRRKSKSLIPEQAQVPVAIGGAIVLALILAWRFSQRGGEAPAPAPPAPMTAAAPADAAAAPGMGLAVQTTEGADLQVLQDLVAELRKRMVETPPAATAPPPLARNPFSPFAAGPPPPESDPQPEAGSPPLGMSPAEIQGLRGFVDAPALEEPDGPSEEALERLGRLQSLQLTATMRTGGWAMAVINDGYYRVGEKVEGFTVAEIGEKGVTLRDAQGTEILPMKNLDPAPTPGLTRPPAPRTARPAEEERGAPPRDDQAEEETPVETETPTEAADSSTTLGDEVS